MSKEKQIEEMAKIFCGMKNGCDGCMWDKAHCNERNYAEEIYNAGYRKQSEPISCGHEKGGEWISVEERLPDLETARTDGHHIPKSVRVLCACKQRSGKVFVKEGYYELFSNKPCWRIPGSIDSVTHWMPLPEPPMMKGGAE